MSPVLWSCGDVYGSDSIGGIFVGPKNVDRPRFELFAQLGSLVTKSIILALNGQYCYNTNLGVSPRDCFSILGLTAKALV